GVPADALERAVGAAPQRVGEPVRAVLVVVEPQRLLARVAPRGRVPPVAPDPGEPPARHLHLQAAVARAQHARRRPPPTVHRRPPRPDLDSLFELRVRHGARPVAPLAAARWAQGGERGGHRLAYDDSRSTPGRRWKAGKP